MKAQIPAIVLLLAILAIQLYATFGNPNGVAAGSALFMSDKIHDDVDREHGAIGQIYAQGEANRLLITRRAMARSRS